MQNSIAGQSSDTNSNEELYKDIVKAFFHERNDRNSEQANHTDDDNCCGAASPNWNENPSKLNWKMLVLNKWIRNSKWNI